MTRLLTCLLLLACPLSVLAAPPASPSRVRFPRPGRKIIVYGWELGFREISDIRRNAQVMQRQPFDGIPTGVYHSPQMFIKIMFKTSILKESLGFWRKSERRFPKFPGQNKH